MGRINKLRGFRRYAAWAIIGLAVGFVLGLLDHYFEPDQPIYVVIVIGVLAGLTTAFYSERADRKAGRSSPPRNYPE